MSYNGSSHKKLFKDAHDKVHTVDSYSDGRCLGDIVVSVLVIGPKGRGFNLGLGDGYLWAIKILSTPCFGWEVRPVQCRKILWHVENHLRHFR
jgi:hypothetical protein